MQMSEIKAKADERASRMMREWRGGTSYNTLAKRYKISRTRIRQIIQRAKILERGEAASRNQTR